MVMVTEKRAPTKMVTLETDTEVVEVTELSGGMWRMKERQEKKQRLLGSALGQPTDYDVIY